MCKQLVLVCKLNKVSFEEADKVIDKYIADLKEISYQEKHGGITEKAVYSNNDGSKIFEVLTQWHRDINKYSLSIYELMENREIKVTKVNGDFYYTKINGSEKEIINHFNDNNFLLNDLENQVKEIEFTSDEYLFAGEKERKIIYNFIYDDKADCYLY